MKLWSLMGNSQKLDGGAMFGNAPRALWGRWAAPDDENRIDLACRALLATPLNGKTVLFEAGIGAFFDPKLRAASTPATHAGRCRRSGSGHC